MFGKIGRFASEEVIFDLISLKFLSSSLFGTEVCPLNEKAMRLLNFTVLEFSWNCSALLLPKSLKNVRITLISLHAIVLLIKELQCVEHWIIIYVCFFCRWCLAPFIGNFENLTTSFDCLFSFCYTTVYGEMKMCLMHVCTCRAASGASKNELIRVTYKLPTMWRVLAVTVVLLKLRL